MLKVEGNGNPERRWRLLKCLKSYNPRELKKWHLYSLVNFASNHLKKNNNFKKCLIEEKWKLITLSTTIIILRIAPLFCQRASANELWRTLSNHKGNGLTSLLFYFPQYAVDENLLIFSKQHCIHHRIAYNIVCLKITKVYLINETMNVRLS